MIKPFQLILYLIYNINLDVLIGLYPQRCSFIFLLGAVKDVTSSTSCDNPQKWDLTWQFNCQSSSIGGNRGS